MARKATNQVTTIDIDISKNSSRLIGLYGRFGSTTEVSRGHENVRCWGKSGSQ